MSKAVAPPTSRDPERAAMEHRLRPIVHSIETGSYKSALTKVDKELKKKNTVELRAAKAYVLAHMGHGEEAAALARSLDVRDGYTMFLVSSVFRMLGLASDILRVYEQVAASGTAYGSDAAVRADAFLWTVRTHEYKKQQMQAMRLSATSMPYFYWSIASLALQAADARLLTRAYAANAAVGAPVQRRWSGVDRAVVRVDGCAADAPSGTARSPLWWTIPLDAEDAAARAGAAAAAPAMEPKLWMLCETMLAQKLATISPRAAVPQEVVLFYVSECLCRTSKWDLALEWLSEERGCPLRVPHENLLLTAAVLHRRAASADGASRDEDELRCAELCEQLLSSHGQVDDWGVWSLLMQTAETSDAARSVLNRALAQWTRQADPACTSVRAPWLAQLHGSVRAAQTSGGSSEALSACWSSFCTYVSLFGDRSCCFQDVLPALAVLEARARAALSDAEETGADARALPLTKPSHAATIASLRHHVVSAADTPASCGLPRLSAQVKRAWSDVLAASQTSSLTLESLVALWVHASADSLGDFFPALCMLHWFTSPECVPTAQQSPALRVLQVLALGQMLAGEAQLARWTAMEPKHILLDSATYVVLDDQVRTMPASAQAVCASIRKFHLGFEMEYEDCVSRMFSSSVLSKVLDFERLHRRCAFSLTLESASIELLYLRLAEKPASALALLSSQHEDHWTERGPCVDDLRTVGCLRVFADALDASETPVAASAVDEWLTAQRLSDNRDESMLELPVVAELGRAWIARADDAAAIAWPTYSTSYRPFLPKSAASVSAERRVVCLRASLLCWLRARLAGKPDASRWSRMVSALASALRLAPSASRLSDAWMGSLWQHVVAEDAAAVAADLEQGLAVWKALASGAFCFRNLRDCLAVGAWAREVPSVLCALLCGLRAAGAATSAWAPVSRVLSDWLAALDAWVARYLAGAGAAMRRWFSDAPNSAEESNADAGRWHLSRLAAYLAALPDLRAQSAAAEWSRLTEELCSSWVLALTKQSLSNASLRRGLQSLKL